MNQVLRDDFLLDKKTGPKQSRRMKKPPFVLLMVFGFWSARLAHAEGAVELRGIINFSNQPIAVLQVGKWPYILDAGEKEGTVELVQIDPDTGIVKTLIDGTEQTNSISLPGSSAGAKSRIYLHNVDFKTAMRIYGHYLERTILWHPNFVNTSFSCDCNWPAEKPSKSDIGACFEQSLKRQGIASLEDGDSFLQVIPAGMVQSAVLGARDLPAATATTNSSTTNPDMIAPGLIDFFGVSISQVLDIYARLIDRKQNGSETVSDCCGAGIYFTTTCPLSKAQAIYAFETQFRWHGLKIVLNDDKTFNVAAYSMFTQAEVIQLASRLAVGMPEQTAMNLLENNGFKATATHIGLGTNWYNFVKLPGGCMLNIKFVARGGVSSNGLVQAASIQSNGVTIASIPLRKGF